MLHIETHGSWRQMGEQYGEAARSLIHKAIQYFAPWSLRDGARAAKAASFVRTSVGREFPELIEESEGMARSAGVNPDAMLVLRFLPDLSAAAQLHCSVVFLNDSDRGPVLARNEDIEPDVSVEIQVCRTARPSEGPATVLLTYVSFVAGVVMNEHGLAVGGTSAHATGAESSQGGKPNSIAFHVLSNRCRRVGDISRELSHRRFAGKGCVAIVGDATGDSSLLEFLPGLPPVITPRPRDRDWQACTNNYITSIDRVFIDPPYLCIGYARYGRILHKLSDNPMARTIENVQRLLGDVAMPGPCVPAAGLKLNTAYSTVMLLRDRRLLLADGHPAKAEFQEFAL